MYYVQNEKEFPQKLKKFNWGAFLLTWIWGLGNGYYKALLLFIPFAGAIIAIPYSFYLGFKGNEIAWKNFKGDTEEEFTAVQKKWALAGVIVTLLVILFVVVPMSFLYKIGMDFMKTVNREVTIPFIQKTYNSDNFKELCAQSSDKNECYKKFKEVKDECGRVTKLKPIDSKVESTDGYTVITLQSKGDFEKTKKKNAYITVTVKQINGEYHPVSVNFEI